MLTHSLLLLFQHGEKSCAFGHLRASVVKLILKNSRLSIASPLDNLSILDIIAGRLKLTNSMHAEIAQLVEHATENRGVVSSILSLGTPGQMRIWPTLAGVVQLVERLLAKEKVTSSSLVARSLPPMLAGSAWPCGQPLPAELYTGDVAKR